MEIDLKTELFEISIRDNLLIDKLDNFVKNIIPKWLNDNFD